MLEKVDLNRKMGKKEYKEWMDDLQPKLSYLQRACKEQKIPVMIVFEGFGAAGKGTLINKIIEPLDPEGIFRLCYCSGDQGRENASVPVAFLDEDSVSGKNCNF